MVYYMSRDGRIETRDPREPWMPFVGFLSDHKHKLPALAEVRILGDFDWPINPYVSAFFPYSSPALARC